MAGRVRVDGVVEREGGVQAGRVGWEGVAGWVEVGKVKGTHSL